MSRIFRTVLCCITVCVAVLSSFDALSEERLALDKLVGLLASSQDIQGDFVQFMVDSKGTRVQETKGSFKAKKPDYFYWETKAPLAQQIFVYDGEITVYDPDLEQASVQILGDDFSATPALLFNGDAQGIAREFIVEERSGSEGEEQFLLFPIEDGSLFEVLRVRFKANKLSDLRISDSLGQDTTISFIQTYVDSGLKPSDFKPVLPEGTDVIRQSD